VSAVARHTEDATKTGCGGKRSANQRVVVTPTSWVPQEMLDLAEWSEHGRRLGLMGRGSGWWIGDWLRYGNAKWGEKYARATSLTGYDIQTLMNMVWIASHIEISRRREKLSWSHHAAVASKPQHEQEYWLDRAEAERLSVKCMREEITRLRAAASRTANAAARVELAAVCPICGSHLKGASLPARRAATRASR